MTCNMCNLKTGIIIETKYWRAILNQYQSYLGRVVVILKEHKQSLSEVSSDEAVDFFYINRILETAIKQAFNAEMFNTTCMTNNAFARGVEPHVHFHIRPRYSHPIIFDGQTFVDKEFGKHYDRTNRDIPPPELYNSILRTIQSFIVK